MRRLAQLRKAAEAARLQAKQLAASDGRLQPCGLLFVWCPTVVAGGAAASDSEHSLDEDEFFVKN